MTHTCNSTRVLASYSAGDTRANRRAEWTAGEQRATGHPEAHVHFDPDRDAFTVVADEEVEL